MAVTEPNSTKLTNRNESMAVTERNCTNVAIRG